MQASGHSVDLIPGDVSKRLYNTSPPPSISFTMQFWNFFLQDKRANLYKGTIVSKKKKVQNSLNFSCRRAKPIYAKLPYTPGVSKNLNRFSAYLS